MQINWSEYNLTQLREHAVQSYREGGGTRPDVLLVQIQGQHAVLKDHNAADHWFALLIGPLLAWRECKGLNSLADIDGIPNLLARPDKRSFLMVYHPSEQIVKLKNIEPNWPEFFNKLESLIRQLHQHGIAHNDLRNPTNTLINEQGEPVLVDLVACFFKGSKWNIIGNYFFAKFCQVDLSAITKMKSKVAPELIAENDIHAEQIAGKAGMAVKGFGQWVRKISRKLFTS